MNLEKQVVSLELAKRLKELGVKQESLFLWWENTREGLGKWRIEVSIFLHSQTTKTRTSLGGRDMVSTFTVAELGEMLKRKKYMLIPVTVEGEWQGADIINGSYLPLGHMDEVTEADARAKMLIYLIENGLVTPKSQ